MDVERGLAPPSVEAVPGEVMLMPPSDWSPPPPPPPQPPQPPPPQRELRLLRPPPSEDDQTPIGLVIALQAAAIGWLIIGFELFMVYVFVGREESCSANRGNAYQSCVRQEDVTELGAEGVAIGLAVLRWPSCSVASAYVGLWVHGSQGGWEPSRPFPYDPLPTAWGHVTMVICVVIGSLVGALVPLSRWRRDPER